MSKETLASKINEQLSELDERKAKDAFTKALEESCTKFTCGDDGAYRAYHKGTVVRLAPNYGDGTVFVD